MAETAHHRHEVSSVACAVVTVSDTRTEADDLSGRLVRSLLEAAGHAVCRCAMVKDEPEEIERALADAAADSRCQAILITGGTGVSARDCTADVVAARLDRRLEGFGELFRMLSFDEIGARAMLSRAVGGVCAGRAVFCVPGSTDAVRLAMERLILPALGHLIWELERTQPPA